MNWSAIIGVHCTCNNIVLNLVKPCKKNQLNIFFIVNINIFFFYFISGLPVVSITYSAQWRFAEILPSKCSNISTRLDDLEKEIVDIFANQCQEIRGISASVQFNYSFMAFTVNIHDLTLHIYMYFSFNYIYNTN